MTALTKAHLKKLNDADLRAIALRIITDTVNALDAYIDEHGLTNHPSLDPTPFHEAADGLRKFLTNPDNEYEHKTRERHWYAVVAFRRAASDVGKSITGDWRTFPPYLNAVAVGRILTNVYHNRHTPHRPSVNRLLDTLVEDGDVFIPGYETTVGYALKAICGTSDPRLSALAGSYIKSGLQVNLRPAIDEAAQQLARLDELADLNR